MERVMGEIVGRSFQPDVSNWSISQCMVGVGQQYRHPFASTLVHHLISTGTSRQGAHSWLSCPVQGTIDRDFYEELSSLLTWFNLQGRRLAMYESIIPQIRNDGGLLRAKDLPAYGVESVQPWTHSHITG